MTTVIKNITKLNPLKLTEVLRTNGVTVEDGKSKSELIHLAAEAKLWKYSGNVVPTTYKQKYGATQRCGDELSDTLNGATRDADKNVDLEALRIVQRDNGIDPSRWAHLNNGQQVMNTSNVLRGKLRRAEYVRIGGIEWNKPVEADAPKKSKKR